MQTHRLLKNAALAVSIAIPVTVSQTTEGWSQIDEVIVTTRKREENLQDIPLSVTAIGSAEIQKLGIDAIGDVAKFTPGVEFDEGFGGQDVRIVIRGLSPTRGRSNAAFLVDGIDFTGEAVGTAGGGFAVNQRLMDIERVEVVKGPQSALYGRSAFAGAVQYITKNPNMDEFEGEVGFDIATDEQYEVSSAISGPVADGLGLRLNGLWYDEDGFHSNSLSANGENIGGADGWGLAATALWEASDSLTFKGRVAYSEDDFEPRAQARVPSNTLQALPAGLVRGFGVPPIAALYPGCTQPGLLSNRDGSVASCLGQPGTFVTGTMPNGDDLTIANSPNPRTGNDYPGTELETLNATLVATWDLDFGTITSYTGYASSESDQLFDGQWDALAPGLHTSLDGSWSFTLPDCGFADCSPYAQSVGFQNDTDLFSQEFRFATNFEGPLNFTIGANYWNEDVKQQETGMTVAPAVFRTTNVATLPAAASILPSINATNARNNDRETDHWSIYGKAEWEITDQFKATFEGRYVEEEITVTGPQCDVAATTALTGLAGIDLGTDTNGDGEITEDESATLDGILDACNALFRGGSSSAQAVAGGSLAIGTYSLPVTKDSSAESSDSFFAPKVSLEWAPNDDQLWYVSVAKGVKPGGISTLLAGSFFTPSVKSFDKEKLTAYEIGGKTTWADGTLQINGAAFFQDYTDKQVGVTQFNQVTQTDVGAIENAGEAEIWGIELDARWQPDDRWTLTAGYSWVDAEYTKFESITGSGNEIARNILSGNAGCLEIIDNDPAINDGISDRCLISRTGNKIEDIPEHTFVGSAQYSAPLPNTEMEWFVQASTAYTGERYMEENNIKMLESYWNADLRAGLSADAWDLVFYVDNVFDDDTVKSGVDAGSIVNTLRQGAFPPGPTDGVLVSLPDPRVFGLRGQIRF